MVLNAFRHHRVLRFGDFVKVNICLMCSTPFGITGCYAPAFSAASHLRRCAQRLSASQGATHSRRVWSDLQQQVLNAFRHHRVLRREPGTDRERQYTVCSTPFGITGCYAWDWVPLQEILLGAQRLSASQGATPATISNGFSLIRCAQRLSASQGATRSGRKPHNANCPGCSTPFGITGCYAVLMSPTRVIKYKCSTPFGITGCYAVLMSPTRVIKYKCSTPFGITGCYAGSRCGSFTGPFLVLNAFRHHRVLRPESSTTSTSVTGAQRLSASQGATPHRPDDRSLPNMCSTPFGITGCYAFRVYIIEMTGRKCSTPFGITGCYAGAIPAWMRSLSCAQRLSASQGATLAHLLSRVEARRGCSTPFGITGCYARELRRQCAVAGCSTPFGITGCYAKTRSAWVRIHLGAQRLSASQGATQPDNPFW